jgi:hypothetical protein
VVREKYYAAVRTLSNFVALPQGPVQKRPGTYYIATASGSGVNRIISFEHSTDAARVLELGDKTMRVYK